MAHLYIPVLDMHILIINQNHKNPRLLSRKTNKRLAVTDFRLAVIVFTLYTFSLSIINYSALGFHCCSLCAKQDAPRHSSNKVENLELRRDSAMFENKLSSLFSLLLRLTLLSAFTVFPQSGVFLSSH